MSALRAPFPYFGGKRLAAQIIWERFGDPGGYVEPFCGSAAVLLNRPAFKGRRVETINDRDGWVANVWRAIKADPAGVAAECAGPLSEVDIHARMAWLNERRDGFVAWLEGDPEHYDAKAAAWWLTVASGSIGHPSEPGPWITRGGSLVSVPASSGVKRCFPALGSDRGVYANGRDVAAGMAALADRLSHVRITCGGWNMVVTPAALCARNGGDGSIAVLLDPPYEVGYDIYGSDGVGLSAAARDWCLRAPADMRIALCGYDSEHDELLAHGWTKVFGKAGSSGYGAGRASDRERIWFSPACLKPATQDSLFGDEAA
ncbi:DNA adenine methylase [Cutibacterium sp. WCA-380-WT-3A]|uniref:DNA adenine methylase n=1 Tax=Cutibacterium porci TaxID=2605781 RepID=A0A7K0J5U3_9ACTN|nr:DNA adenine methylase [Cutibacterium porci]MSS45306.1 DNA adenine methylase [Cutibacterium porci]